MVVLVTGATGFIGARLARALECAGHRVIRLRRTVARGSNEITGDFSRDLEPKVWIPRLQGVDAVINTVGVIRAHGSQQFHNLHTRAPQALFAACCAIGVRHVIQLSALGADRGTSAYFISKRRADEFLASLPLRWTIVQPSLVYGPEGQSARLFTLLASLPRIPLPGNGIQQVQPIHIDDLVECIVAIVHNDHASCERIALVGPQPISLKHMLAALRGAMQLGRARFVPLPMGFIQVVARLGSITGRGVVDMDTLAMLQKGNTADAQRTEQLLHHRPRGVEAFIGIDERTNVRMTAKLSWLLPLLRASIAAVWIWTGIVSLGLYPQHASYVLLARAHITGALAPVFLYGAGLLDLCLGLATVLMRRRRLLWLGQMAILLLYTAIICVALPEFWLHPYGPILKNLPLLASIYLLYSLEDPRWRTAS